MRAITLTFAVTCALAVAGCSSKQHAAETHHVAIRAMQFVPATLEVQTGDTVVWTNEDIVPHTVTAAGSFDSKEIANAQTWSYTATTAGTFAYGCSFHPTMKATLTVR